MRTLIACLVFGLVAPFATAADKVDAKTLNGSWKREADGLDINFRFSEKGKLQFSIKVGDEGMMFSADYKVADDGVVTITILNSKEKGDAIAAPAKGASYGFKFKVEGDKAILSDLVGDNVEGAKDVIEGDYERAKQEEK